MQVSFDDIVDIGQRFHAEGFDIWEEPCAFRKYELTRQSTRKLKNQGLDVIIRVASGEVVPKATQLGQFDFIPWKRGFS